MNRTRGFVNQNRFKSGRAVKRLNRVADSERKKKTAGKNKVAEQVGFSRGFGA